MEGNENFGTNEETDNNGAVLLANKENNPDNDDVWYLDMGASNHMCEYKHIFNNIWEITNGHVSFGDASKVHVEGQCNILVHLKDTTQKFISSVYYVPKMKTNILSLGQLMELGYLVYMKENVLYLRDQNNYASTSRNDKKHHV